MKKILDEVYFEVVAGIAVIDPALARKYESPFQHPIMLFATQRGVTIQGCLTG